MDEKTRKLREIFMDVADEATLTERQEQSRGSLDDRSELDARLRSVIESMRERYEFRTSLSTDALVDVVRGFFAGESDAEIAGRLDAEPSGGTVARARLDLHLVTDRDRQAPFDLGVLRDAVEGSDDSQVIRAVAADQGVSESTVRRYLAVVETERERRAVGDRYREEFERLLSDRDLAERLTREVRETGLEDATDGMESNVSF